MTTVVYKTILLCASTLIGSICIAQSTGVSPVGFKEIQKEKMTDNFIGREIKKKELQIAPSKIIVLNNVNTKPSTTRKKKGH